MFTVHDVITAMETFGGSFAKAIANAFRRADRNNFSRLKTAFPELWEEYTVMATQYKKRDPEVHFRA